MCYSTAAGSIPAAEGRRDPAKRRGRYRGASVFKGAAGSQMVQLFCVCAFDRGRLFAIRVPKRIAARCGEGCV